MRRPKKNRASTDLAVQALQDGLMLRHLILQFPEGMRDEVDFTITRRCGFEEFGSYETWQSGWDIRIGNTTVSHHDLASAVEEALRVLEREQS